LDLPLADLIETQLHQHVEDKLEQQRAESTLSKQLEEKESSASLSTAAAESDSAAARKDAELFPSSSPSSVTGAIHQVFQGYWLLDAFTPASHPSSASAS